jgi:hypothetical protein
LTTHFETQHIKFRKYFRLKEKNQKKNKKKNPQTKRPNRTNAPGHNGVRAGPSVKKSRWVILAKSLPSLSGEPGCRGVRKRRYGAKEGLRD